MSLSAAQSTDVEYRCPNGFTTYIVRRDSQGAWSLVVARKLLGLFTRPEEVHPLANYQAVILRSYVDDGTEFREVYIEPRADKSAKQKPILICPQTDEATLDWFESMLIAHAHFPVRRE